MLAKAMTKLRQSAHSSVVQTTLVPHLPCQALHELHPPSVRLKSCKDCRLSGSSVRHISYWPTEPHCNLMISMGPALPQHKPFSALFGTRLSPCGRAQLEGVSGQPPCWREWQSLKFQCKPCLPTRPGHVPTYIHCVPEPCVPALTCIHGKAHIRCAQCGRIICAISRHGHYLPWVVTQRCTHITHQTRPMRLYWTASFASVSPWNMVDRILLLR